MKTYSFSPPPIRSTPPCTIEPSASQNKSKRSSTISTSSKVEGLTLQPATCSLTDQTLRTGSNSGRLGTSSPHPPPSELCLSTACSLTVRSLGKSKRFPRSSRSLCVTERSDLYTFSIILMGCAESGEQVRPLPARRHGHHLSLQVIPEESSCMSSVQSERLSPAGHQTLHQTHSLKRVFNPFIVNPELGSPPGEESRRSKKFRMMRR